MYAIKKKILIIEDGRVRYSMNGWYPLLATRQFLSPLIHIRLGYFHKWLIYWKLLAFNCKTNRRPTDRTIDRRARIYYCSVFAYVLIFGWIIFILSIELRAVRWIIDMPIRLAQSHTHTHTLALPLVCFQLLIDSTEFRSKFSISNYVFAFVLLLDY